MWSPADNNDLGKMHTSCIGLESMYHGDEQN